MVMEKQGGKKKEFKTYSFSHRASRDSRQSRSQHEKSLRQHYRMCWFWCVFVCVYKSGTGGMMTVEAGRGYNSEFWKTAISCLARATDRT